MRQQTYCSDYWLTCPYKHVINTNLYCPLYAPMVQNGMCRMCMQLPQNHRKYYVFSRYARKIQFCALRYIYKQFVRKHIQPFQKRSYTRHPLINIKMFYYRFWRKWDPYYLELFLKNYR
jgi:hypothetical protein